MCGAAGSPSLWGLWHTHSTHTGEQSQSGMSYLHLSPANGPRISLSSIFNLENGTGKLLLT